MKTLNVLEKMLNMDLKLKFWQMEKYENHQSIIPVKEKEKR